VASEGSDPVRTVREAPRRQLRRLLERDEMLSLPAIHDAFSARAAQELGFEAVYLGGGVTVAIGMHAMPDMTMVSIADVVEAARPIVESVDVALIIDFDDGGGNPLQVRRSMMLAEAAGISGVQIEDTDFTYPKHLPPKVLGNVMDFSHNHLLSRKAAVQRIRAAVEARRDPDMVVIGRTDGALVSFEECLTRMRLLAEAGADVVFPTHLPFDRVREVVDHVPVPIMCCPTRVGSSTSQEREYGRAGGLRIMLEATPVSYAAYGAIIATLAELKETGGVEADYSATLKTVQEYVRYPEWGEFAGRYAG
jgi:methylisocitrate lyase